MVACGGAWRFVGGVWRLAGGVWWCVGGVRRCAVVCGGALEVCRWFAVVMCRRLLIICGVGERILCGSTFTFYFTSNFTEKEKSEKSR